MKIVRYSNGDSIRLGTVVEQPGAEPGWAIADLTPMLYRQQQAVIADIGALLSQPQQVQQDVASWSRGVQAAVAAGADIGDVELLSPEHVTVLAPCGASTTVICVGGNYASHSAEMAGGKPEPDAAVRERLRKQGIRGFLKSSRCIVAPGQAISLPGRHPEMVDYEGEIGVVIGRRCHAVDNAEAEAAIAGYVLVNDVSARDWIVDIRNASTPQEGMYAWRRNLLGKQFPTFCPMGPTFVPKEDIASFDEIVLRTTVNGAVRQEASMTDLVYSPAEIVEYFSRFHELYPGDVIATGTPAGTGSGMKPPAYLRPGDVVRVSATGLGVLESPVTAAE